MEEVKGVIGINEKAEELVKRTAIENSPFEVIEVEGKCFGVMGKYRITEERDSVEGVILELSEMNWNRILQVIMICLDQRENLVNLIKEESNED